MPRAPSTRTRISTRRFSAEDHHGARAAPTHPPRLDSGAPLPGGRADRERRTLPSDVLFIPTQTDSTVNMQLDLQRTRELFVLNRQLPGQEYLRAILIRGEVRGIEAAVFARDDGVRLRGIEDHHRATTQR